MEEEWTVGVLKSLKQDMGGVEGGVGRVGGVCGWRDGVWELVKRSKALPDRELNPGHPRDRRVY